MHTGELYYPNEESIFDEQLKKLDLLYEFNSTRPTEQKRWQALMKEMFAEVGENCYLEPPFHANWDGRTSISATLVAYGDPCRVAREISEHDREFYYKDRRITKKIFDEIKNI